MKVGNKTNVFSAGKFYEIKKRRQPPHLAKVLTSLFDSLSFVLQFYFPASGKSLSSSLSSVPFSAKARESQRRIWCSLMWMVPLKPRM